MQNAGQRMIRMRFQHHMHMVRHHAPRLESVAHSVEVSHRAGDDFRNHRIAQKTCAVPGIKVSLDPLRMQFVQSPTLGRAQFPPKSFRRNHDAVTLTHPRSQYMRRKRIRRPEGYGASRLGARPMRQVGPVANGERIVVNHVVGHSAEHGGGHRPGKSVAGASRP